MLGRLATWPRPWGLVRERRTARGPQGHGGPERVDSVVPCHCGAVARCASSLAASSPRPAAAAPPGVGGGHRRGAGIGTAGAACQPRRASDMPVTVALTGWVGAAWPSEF